MNILNQKTSDGITDEWIKDSQVDHTDLGKETANISSIHSKYLKYFSIARKELSSLIKQKARLEKLKYEYYSGQLNGQPEKLKKLNWEPFQIKLLKSQIDVYIKSDKELLSLIEEMSEQETIIKITEEILKALNGRVYSLNKSIDLQMFINGR